MNAIATAIVEGTLPGRVWLYANYNCNLTCTYCLTESGPRVARRELGRGRMVEVAREAAANGFTDLGVTGGEPFLLTWLPDALAEMSEHLPVLVLTNGTLFPTKRLPQLDPILGRPVALQISLDRPDPDDNDEMRGPENFRKVVESVPRLVDKGIQVRIATTVESIEDADLDRLCALHRDLGVPDDDHIIRPIVRRGRAVDHDLGVTAKQVDLPAELTITVDGAFWSPFGPTVHDGALDTDLLITRTTRPLDVPAKALVRLIENRPVGDDVALNIR
ncbi:radical SAM protein [Actinokineospora sp.]|uniref:radical SAM protein n=1 Tax=Actinokineospora sp. TaxID=1872133 RepID=UPI004037A2EF